MTSCERSAFLRGFAEGCRMFHAAVGCALLGILLTRTTQPSENLPLRPQLQTERVIVRRRGRVIRDERYSKWVWV